MYDISYFKEADASVVKAFMRTNSFGTLIGCSRDIPVATQVPFLIEEVGEKLLLKGHIMRQTDHHKALIENSNVLCLFTGPNSYVSARNYNDQQTASTWNYLTVQASGILRFLPADDLVGILQQTTAVYENDPGSPSSFEHLPHAYIDKLANAIEGFEVEVTGLRHVFKLSQNKKEGEYERVIESLQAGGADGQAIAHEMKARSQTLFPK